MSALLRTAVLKNMSIILSSSITSITHSLLSFEIFYTSHVNSMLLMFLMLNVFLALRALRDRGEV